MEPSYYEQLWALLDSMREDNEKCFEKNNASAGLRLRRDIKKIEQLAKAYRKASLKK